MGLRALLPHLGGIFYGQRETPPRVGTFSRDSNKTQFSLALSDEASTKQCCGGGRLSKDNARDVKRDPNMRADVGMKTLKFYLLLPAPGKGVRGRNSEERLAGWMRPVPAVSSTTAL